MNRKVVYSNFYGGFSLSPKAIKWLLDHGVPAVDENQENKPEKYIEIIEGSFGFGKEYIEIRPGFVLDSVPHMKRHDPLLVECVETLGSEANGWCTDIQVKDIGESLYRIEYYDGMETVITEYDDWQ